MTNSTMQQSAQQSGQQPGGSITIEDAPAIPGLSFRYFAGESDYPGLVEVLNESKQADGFEEVDTAERMQERYSKAKNFDIASDLIIAEVDDNPIAYSRVVWWEELDGTRVYASRHFFLPEWRGKGLEATMLDWSEARLRTIADSHPADAPKLLDTGTLDVPATQYLMQIIEQHGYEPIRYSYDMVRPDLDNLPDVPLAEGIEVRLVDKDDREQMHTIWAAEVEAFRDHWGEGTTDESDFDRWGIDGNFQPELWQVAWDGDEVVGMVRNFIDEPLNERLGKKRGYTENISVRRSWRRRGVARALIARSFKMLRDMGMTEAALGVDAANPNGARQLYESMGFQTVRQYISFRKPMF